MNRKNEPKIVTVDDGTGPAKLLHDARGRLLTKEYVAKMRDQQQAELDHILRIREKLLAKDAETQHEIVRQYKDRLAVQLTMLDRYKSQMQETLAKLDAGDATTVATVLTQMGQQLSWRAESIRRARDQSVKWLDELEADRGVEKKNS